MRNSIRSGYYFCGRKISRKIPIREYSENFLHAKNWCYTVVVDCCQDNECCHHWSLQCELTLAKAVIWLHGCRKHKTSAVAFATNLIKTNLNDDRYTKPVRPVIMMNNYIKLVVTASIACLVKTGPFEISVFNLMKISKINTRIFKLRHYFVGETQSLSNRCNKKMIHI